MVNLLAHLNIQDIIDCAKQAGEVLLSHFYSGLEHNITVKSDQTPVTKADVAANAVIVDWLSKLNPSIPVLSEENSIEDFSMRQQWEYYWLVDPLDGTRGFIRRDPQFCVNIALIEKHQPILGVIYSPVEKFAAYAIKNQGAFWQQNQEIKKIHTSAMNPNHLHLLTGRYDQHAKFKENFRAHFKELSITEMNSAIKFGLIAKGVGDIYVRFGKTSEWDTASGQCIVEEAGGLVVDFEGRPLQYNTKSSLINPSFLAMGDASQCQYYLEIIRKLL